MTLELLATQSPSSELPKLRQNFDVRLKSLKAPDADDRLRQALRTPITSDDNVIAGDPHLMARPVLLVLAGVDSNII